MAAAILAVVTILIVYVLLTKTHVSEQGDGVVVSSENLIHETATYIDEGARYDINKNKLTRTAEVTVSRAVGDSDEYMDWLGQKSTAMPFTINLSCALFTAAFFDPDNFREAVKGLNQNGAESEPITQDNEFAAKLEGFRITKFVAVFSDAETDENIASCSSTGKGNENISFEVLRDYSGVGSLFGSEIGKYD